MILQSHINGIIEKAGFFDPSIIECGDGYLIYLTAKYRMIKNYKALPSGEMYTNIVLFKSHNLLQWYPVDNKKKYFCSASNVIIGGHVDLCSEYYDGISLIPTVWKKNDTYKMIFYKIVNHPLEKGHRVQDIAAENNNYQLCYAESKNAIEWEIKKTNIRCSNTKNKYKFAYTPNYFSYKNKDYLFVTFLPVKNKNYEIGIIDITDLDNITYIKGIFKDNIQSVYYPCYFYEDRRHNVLFREGILEGSESNNSYFLSSSDNLLDWKPDRISELKPLLTFDKKHGTLITPHIYNFGRYYLFYGVIEERVNKVKCITFESLEKIRNYLVNEITIYDS